MIDLDFKEKEKILSQALESRYIVSDYRINNKNYFIKLADYSDDGMELVVEKIASLLNIKCAHYETMMVNGQIVYLSEDLGNECCFISGKQLFISRVSHSLYRINDVFKKLYPIDNVLLFSDLVKIYLLDVFLMHGDRHLGNWGIMEKRNIPEGLAIFDNAKAFLNNTQTYLRAKTEKSYEIIYSRDGDPEDKIINLNMGDLEFFINNYYEEYVGYLVSLYEILTPEFIKDIFTKVKEDLNKTNFRYEAKFLEKYKMNYQAIGDLLRKYSLIDEPIRIMKK